MGAPVVVIVPMLGRPHRVAPLLASIEAATPAGSYRVLFVCTPGDTAVPAVIAAGAECITVNFRPGDYSRKIHAGIAATAEPLIFTGACDLVFHPGWLEAAAACLDPGIGVVGTQDLGNPRVLRGDHATHSLVTRAYIEQHGTIDEPGKLFHEGYHHNFCDTEMVETAKARGAWRFAFDSVVEHLHPHWQKATEDEVYRLGQSRFVSDRLKFDRRRRLWGG